MWAGVALITRVGVIRVLDLCVFSQKKRKRKISKIQSKRNEPSSTRLKSPQKKQLSANRKRIKIGHKKKSGTARRACAFSVLFVSDQCIYIQNNNSMGSGVLSVGLRG